MISDLLKRARDLASRLRPPEALRPRNLLSRARRLPPDPWKLAVAAVLVALLALWNIHTDWGLAGGSAVRAEAKLQESAQQRLTGVGADWARLAMDGQVAVVSGLAPREEDLIVARGAVRQAAWTGGLLLGGVTRVRSEQARVWAERQGPYPWSAELDRSRITLTGSAPSRAAVVELGALAGALFADRRVINELDVDPVPPGDDWTGLARGALAVLSHLEIGSASIADYDLQVRGEAATPDDAEDARQGLDRLEGLIGPQSSVDVRAPRPQPAAVVAAPPPAARQPEPAVPEPASAATPQADCQQRLNRVLADGEILFEVDSASLTPGSLPMLSELAQVAAACPPFALRVEGHTDDTGEAAANMSLSEQRAGTIVDGLAALGIDRARMTATGMGASRPVADNRSEDGRRANRRIEIIVQN